jgi:hypothetical protein
MCVEDVVYEEVDVIQCDRLVVTREQKYVEYLRNCKLQDKDVFPET